MDEREQARRDGETVERFLADPVILKALADMELDVVREWKAATEWDEQNACWYAIKAVERFGAKLRATVGRGQQAAMEIDRAR
jgi:hypothetical protein